MKTEMRIVEMAVNDLNPAPYNPRKIKDEAREGLARSMDRFGMVEPIVFNTRTKRIVGGHQKASILKEKGVEQCQVVVIDVSEDEEKALNIALNNKNIQGEWDEKALVELLDGLKVTDMIEETGFNELQLEELRLSLPKEMEDLPEPPASKTISYTIIFDSDAQRTRWEDYIRHIKRTFPNALTLAEGITLDINERGIANVKN